MKGGFWKKLGIKVLSKTFYDSYETNKNQDAIICLKEDFSYFPLMLFASNKGMLSGLRQFLATGNSLQTMNYALCFT